MKDHFRIGIVSGKLGDVDGVSLEVDKWIDILKKLGHTVFTLAGRYKDPLKSIPPSHQLTVEKMRFDSPAQAYYESVVFPYLNRNHSRLSQDRKREILERMDTEGKEIATAVFDLIKEQEIDVLLAENTNAMPMTLLGGLAVYEIATTMEVATIFHHHDFWWERSRFSHNHIESLLNRIMPPVNLRLEHVVLSSYAQHILRSLKRIQPHVVPNCEDFGHPPVKDDYNADFRRDMGFDERDVLVIQPTRIVRRKRIEDSVRLLAALKKRYPALGERLHYIISLYQGDEPDRDYVGIIREAADSVGLPVHLISDRVSSKRGTDPEGRKLYTNRDVLACADLVTYLPLWEGFGNALLEAVAAKVPVVTTTYLVYKTDIKPSGIRNIEIWDKYDEHGRLLIPESVLEEIQYVLTHPEERKRRVEENFELAGREFGLPVLKRKIAGLMSEYADEIRASRKRVKKSKMLYSV